MLHPVFLLLLLFVPWPLYLYLKHNFSFSFKFSYYLADPFFFLLKTFHRVCSRTSLSIGNDVKLSSRLHSLTFMAFTLCTSESVLTLNESVYKRCLLLIVYFPNKACPEVFYSSHIEAIFQ